jgi:hypothetical protein
VIIKDKDFKNWVVTIGQGAQTWTKTKLLVACGDKNGNLRWRMGRVTNLGKAEHLEIQKVVAGDQKEAEENKKMQEIDHRHRM